MNPARTDLSLLPKPNTAKDKHALYEVWRGMVRRCHDPKATGFKNYGGRGIAVCEEWRCDFQRFVQDIPPRPSSVHSLDRIDNSQGYFPANVRWATRSEQMRNTRFNRLLSLNEKTQTAEAWAEELGMPISTLFNRLKRGWSDEKALTIPIQPKAANNSIAPKGLPELCKQHGISVDTVESRLRRGWALETAITTPAAPQKGGRKHESRSR